MDDGAVSTALLQRAADRARREPGFLGHVLDAYQARLGVTDEGLRRELGCDHMQLLRLYLCGIPRPEQFREDVENVAARVGVDPLALARVVRLESALGTLAEHAVIASTLRAARRREDEDDASVEGSGRDEPK